LPAVARITARSVTIGQRRLAQLRRLEPPKRDAKAAAAMLAALDNSLDALANLSRAARTGDRAAVDRAAAALQRVQARADGAARKLRLHQCLSNDG
jgi:hypothetical protein